MTVKIWRLLFGVSLFGAGTVTGMAQEVDEDAEMVLDPYEVVVLVDSVQEDMLPPNDTLSPAWTSVGVLSLFFMPPGLVEGVSGVTSLANRDRDADTAVGLEYLAQTFNFKAAVMGLVNQLDLNSNWLIYDVQQRDFSKLSGETVKQIFLGSPVDYVFLVRPRYLFAPDLDQVRASFTVRFYAHTNKVVGRLRATYERTYEYVSPSRGKILRPFREGEKEGLLEEIEIRFASQLDRYPQNEKAYQQERDSAIGLVRNRDTILPSTALLEGWPGTTLDVELRKATEHVTRMMQLDLADIRPLRKEQGDYVRFTALGRSGRPDNMRGYVVAELGENTIYRVRNGNMYSVPKVEVEIPPEE